MDSWCDVQFELPYFPYRQSHDLRAVARIAIFEGQESLGTCVRPKGSTFQVIWKVYSVLREFSLRKNELIGFITCWTTTNPHVHWIEGFASEDRMSNATDLGKVRLTRHEGFLQRTTGLHNPIASDFLPTFPAPHSISKSVILCVLTWITARYTGN